MKKRLWEIEKIVSKGKYNYAVVRNHPKASRFGYVLHHRVVMENHLGRILQDNEVVHHKKKSDKKNNRISNLEVKDKTIHLREHGLENGKSMVLLKCPSCKERFVRQKSKTFLSKNGTFTCCCASCRGKFSRKMQLDGATEEVRKLISENVIKEFNSLDKKFKKLMGC